MLIFRGVTGVTVGWCAVEFSVCVTGFTLHINVLPRQREISLCMIETHVLPGAGVMTVFTGGAELSIVGIFCGMAGVTIRGGPLINSVIMAGGTSYCFMAIDKLEVCGVVIEIYIFPGAGVMTAGAICAELTVVGVFGSMTGITVCWRMYK